MRVLLLVVWVSSLMSGCDSDTEDKPKDGDNDGVTVEDGDCDDTDPTINPAADEICDGIDNDCDGEADEGAIDATLWYGDSDRDGYGTEAYTTLACTQPEDHSAEMGDCDDTAASINPGAQEMCTGLDDDCDGLIDGDDDNVEGMTVWYVDADDDGWGDDGATVEACEPPAGYRLDAGDCDDSNAEISPSAAEQCDGIDNDCDALIDDEDDDRVGGTAWYADTDEDGFGDPTAEVMTQCTQPDGYVLNGTDCDDGSVEAYPGAIETCDGIDNDCDGSTDEEAVGGSVWYRDADGDGFGDVSAIWWACSAPDGYVDSNTDCNDSLDTVNPDQDETCLTAYDDNCDGSNNDPSDTAETGPIGGIEHFVDADGDGFGVPDSMWSCFETGLYSALVSSDCDDLDPLVYPDAYEVCDDIDNDCDDEVDEEDAGECTAYFYDWDGDEYGLSDDMRCLCETEGYYTATVGDDCNDVDEAVSPDAVEVCDGIDNDCNDSTDDGLAVPEADLTSGVCEGAVKVCDGTAGWVEPDYSSFDGYEATEVTCDDQDNDCNGVADEGEAAPPTWYVDADLDGYGDPDWDLSIVACGDSIEGYSSETMAVDCDDDDAESTTITIDADCDTVLTEEDCDDEDDTLGSILDDTNCDGVIDTLYQLYTDPVLSWSEADEACREDGYDGLAVILSSFEQSQIAEISVGTEGQPWLGMLRVGSEWFWRDLSPVADGPTYWWGDADGSGNRGVVLTPDYPDGVWWSANVTEPHRYICEQRASPVATDIDGDGVGAEDDCDDDNPDSTTVATDADCDGVLTADDCDDDDPESTTVATDADCDSVLTADDCDDDDPDIATIVDDDADCDGYVDEADCDDTDATIHPFAGDVYGDGEDSDCDGYDCDAGAYGDAYFQICAERVSWNSGQDACIDRGFDGLVTITSAEEEEFLQNLPSTEYFAWAAGGFGEGYRIWSGFKTGGVGWVSGLPTTYTNFNPGEPSGDGPCVEMSASVGWNDVNCGTAMPYICESR